MQNISTVCRLIDKNIKNYLKHNTTAKAHQLAVLKVSK